MKKYIVLFYYLFFSVFLYAQIDNGYYRVQNNQTGRYLYVYDNDGKAELDGMQLKVDLDAIYLRADLENAISDPGSIIYVEQHGSNYDFQSQNTGVHDIIDQYVSLTPRNGSYSVGATLHGVSAYLGDNKTSKTTGYGIISIDSKAARLWDPIKVSSTSDNYFGVSPDLNSGDKYYTSFFAGFGFSPASGDTKVFYVKDVSNKAVLLSCIEGNIPEETPVIIECTSSDPSDNKLDLLKASGSISGNLLEGVYYNTDNSDASYAVKVHKNQTMVSGNARILSVNSDGKLVFVKPSFTYYPANSSYLDGSSVPSDAATELMVCFTQEDFDLYSASSPGEPEIPNSLDAFVSSAKRIEIYNLLGRKIEFSSSLPAGIYIINGKKTVIR